MRLFKTHNFDQIQGFEFGWSLFGPPMMTVYCYLFGDVMIDSAQTHMQKEVLRITSDHHVRRVYLTHHHEDHSGNASAIRQRPGTDIYGHDITIEKMATAFNILPYQKYMWGKAAPVDIQPAPEKIETILGEMIPVHTPGHSKDHTTYFLQNEGILFSGDLYLGDSIKYFRSDEDVGKQIASLKKILALDFDMLLCSHAPKRKDGQKHLQRKLAFLEDLYGNIIRLWEKGIPEKQIFRSLNLREDYVTKLICFGNVSMLNGIRSAIRHYTSEIKKAGP